MTEAAAEYAGVALHRMNAMPSAAIGVVYPHFDTDILCKFKLMGAWPGNLAVATSQRS